MVELDTERLLDRVSIAGTTLLVVAGVPAYNEEKTIARVVLGAQKHAHIVIVCDDGSSDLTGEIAGRLGAVVIRHERNLGYGAALQSLFKRARELKADVLVTFDSDGQHDPAQIPLLVKPIDEGIAEVVLGSRFMDKNGTAEMPKYRELGIRVITRLTNASVTDAQSGFRAYSKKALEHLNAFESGMSASVELLRAIGKSGLKVCEVPITCKYTSKVLEETSTENPLSHGLGILMSLVKLVVEDRPLVYLGLPGILSLVAGACFGLWMIQIYALEHIIETNIALASISFILIGFFMVSTAITLYAITRLANRVNTGS